LEDDFLGAGLARDDQMKRTFSPQEK
jgi:hypothetical protein